MIYNLYEELGKPTAIIFKNSIENKNIPNEWREGCITALFKKGSRKMASNYRPVSLTCLLIFNSCNLFFVYDQNVHIITYVDTF
jgi:hypothetical protein